MSTRRLYGRILPGSVYLRASLPPQAGGEGLLIGRWAARRRTPRRLSARPRDGTALLVYLLHGYVGHEAVRGGSVPMLLGRLEEHPVARADHLDLSAAALREADALGDVDGRPYGWVCPAVRAPGVKWTLLAATRAGTDGVA